MNLAEYKKKNVGLADFLPWAALVAPGVVSIRTARFSGRRGFAGPTSTAPRPGWLYQGRERSGVDPWELLKGFVDRADRVLHLCNGFVPEADWLDDTETLTYLHSTVFWARHRVRVPETPMHFDALLADNRLPADWSRGSATSTCGR